MNVFVVEDFPAIRRMIVSRLGEIERVDVVGEAEGEADALTLIRKSEPDVVLLDLSLAGGGSGLKVLKELRRGGFSSKVFVVSTESAGAQACVQAGADGFYDKASELERLFVDLANLAR